MGREILEKLFLGETRKIILEISRALPLKIILNKSREGP